MKSLFRLILLPVKIVWRAVATGLRLGWWVARLPIRLVWGTGRFLGLRGLVLIVVGFAVGLFATQRGRELRDKLYARARGEVTDDDLADKVGYELRHAPRTWHLPQPDVAVLNGRVELSGSVPHESGRDDLERVAASVAGVSGVDNNVTVDDTEPTGD